MMTRKAPWAALFVGTLLLQSVGGALAQHAGLNVTLESVKPTPQGSDAVQNFKPLESPLESIVGDSNHEWVSGNAGRDLYKFDVDWGAADGLSVNRNFTQTRVEAKGHAFNTGLQETLTQGMTFAPLTGLSFNMSRQQTEVSDLAGQSLGATEVDSLGLTQNYGKGFTAGSMSFTRKTTDTYAPNTDPLLSRLALSQTTEESAFTLSQGFGMLGKAGKFAYTRGMTSVERPNLIADVQNTDTFGINNTLWADTAFSATYARSHGERLDQLAMQQRGFSLARKLNGADAGVTYENVTRRISGVTDETTKQGFKLPFSFSGTPFNFAFDAQTVQRNKLVLSDSRNASFLTKIAGNDITGSWVRNIVNNGGAENVTSNMSFSLPINFRGSKIALNYSNVGTQVNHAITKKDRVASLVVPLQSVWKGASFTHEIRGAQAAGKPSMEIRTSTLILPFSFLGAPVAADFQRLTQRSTDGETNQFLTHATAPIRAFGKQLGAEGEFGFTNRPGGSEQNIARTKLSVPFRPGPVIIERKTTRDIAATGGAAETQIVNIIGPRVPMNQKASVQADLLLTDMPTGPEQQVTHVNVVAQPLPRVSMTADLMQTDLGPKKDSKSRTVDTSYALSDRLSVNARYLERENLDRGPAVNRLVMVQQKGARTGDLSLRAGVSSNADGIADQPAYSLVEVGVGDPRRIGVNLRYQEYDEAKLVGFANPLIKFQLEHGGPKSVRMVFGYEDQEGRPEPYRRYGVALPLGNSSLDLGFSQNPVDPTDPKAARVRVASVYDAKYSSKVFGDVGMDLGYRYCDYPDDASAPQGTTQWLQVKLSGGKPEGGGAIQLGYSTGDFVTLDAKPERTPTSTLSLKYEKKWTDDGSLSLILNRTTVPNTQLDMADSYETRMQFEKQF